MKYLILILIFFIFLNAPAQDSGADTNRIITYGLLKGLQYKQLYSLESDLSSSLKKDIKQKDSIITGLYNHLQIELLKEPEYKTDWKLIGMFSGFTACLISIVYSIIIINNYK